MIVKTFIAVILPFGQQTSFYIIDIKTFVWGKKKKTQILISGLSRPGRAARYCAASCLDGNTS